ncbi:LppM family (lipo)protein [Pseudolysinimonas sp.]|jgi:hypothetical protein|uniref:LppM family (lipo)protein n=1 Tax=Pseudolysinimonas sp. TaxID=2680009 RepID=UPI003784AD18
MTRRRILPALVTAGVIALALTGCVRFQADLTLNPGDVVDGQIVVAVLATEDTDEARSTALAYVADIESTLLGSLRDASGVTTTEYAQDDYLGTLIEFDDISLDAFSGQRPESLRFVRDGDSYTFTGTLDFSAQSIPSDDTTEDDGNLRVSVTFPGEVTEQQNGEVSGTTVTWTTALDQRVEMSATGAANPPGPPVLLIVAIVVGVLVLLAAVVAVLLLLRSRRAKAAVTPAPVATETPDADEKPAPEV